MPGSMRACIQLWFSGGKIERTIAATQNFLDDIDQVELSTSPHDLSAAINRTYLDAAVKFLPPVDLKKLSRQNIHFALLLEMSGSWDIGHWIAGAAALAVQKINLDKALLPGRKLEYSWKDSGCTAQSGLAAMGELLRRESRIDAVIGPGCSTACEATNHLSGGQKIPQISWGML